MEYSKRISDTELQRKLNASQEPYLSEVRKPAEKHNGDWCAFEIKPGTGQTEEAAGNLNKFVSILDNKKIKAPKSLNIITGTGISYTRQDGINVISLASLGQ